MSNVTVIDNRKRPNEYRNVGIHSLPTGWYLFAWRVDKPKWIGYWNASNRMLTETGGNDGDSWNMMNFKDGEHGWKNITLATAIEPQITVELT